MVNTHQKEGSALFFLCLGRTIGTCLLRINDQGAVYFDPIAGFQYLGVRGAYGFSENTKFRVFQVNLRKFIDNAL